MNLKALAILGVLAVLALPGWLIQSDYWMNFAIMVLYAALLGQAWNILAGYGGQFSFGHAAFFGTGAYAQAILQMSVGLDPWLCFLLSGLLGGIAGAVVGVLSFRYNLRGSYFALVTLAFAEVFRIVAKSVDFTGGGSGLLVPLHKGAASAQFATKAGFYYLIFALTALGLAIGWWLDHGRFGARLIAVRENEEAARALGINAFTTKVIAITLSAILAGFAGAFYVQYFLYIDPNLAYGPDISVAALLAPIIGGLGTSLGPLVGALVLQLVSRVAQMVAGDAPGITLVIFGVILVIMVVALPEGIFGQARISARRLISRRT
ncbi:MAG TPA: branched-chain amino acid ABC transporter permease [Magnetospirillaceae bacterium]|jgi:branched-chain amino acid transport system permease protein